ncbi:hypothetical protein [Clostridium sp. ZS2-4]|uniref:hypothetical protein n=1 Tax=Clostridium sp. ZS2-4 TaxID=2987703 RepID=UPI00227A9DE2|nr:hypothetical protein [Clostridium sp. ZS2-4]MCY6354356.1 hypothetical protein [Clostridium sp. ZS2-4]
MIQITERDLKFLKLLSQEGACSAKIPKIIYPARYSRNRLKKLEEEKLIKKRYNLIMLATKGIEYLESIGEKPKNVSTYQRELQNRIALALDLRYELPNLEIITSSKYKKQQNLNRGMIFVAAARTKQGEDYLIYNVPTKISVENTKLLIKELRSRNSNIYGTIILTKKKNFVQTLINKNIPIRDLIVLPHQEYFLELIDALYHEDFDKKIIELADPSVAGEEDIFTEKKTQYVYKNTVYMNMVLNNISIFSYLQGVNSILSISGSNSNRKYCIVCLDIQQSYIRKEIEKRNLDANIEIELITLSKEDILNTLS